MLGHCLHHHSILSSMSLPSVLAGPPAPAWGLPSPVITLLSPLFSEWLVVPQLHGDLYISFSCISHSLKKEGGKMSKISNESQVSPPKGVVAANFL